MDIPGFWEGAPDIALHVEDSWDAFVVTQGGIRVDTEIGKSPEFNNADYHFKKDNVIIELKEIQTEFAAKPAFTEKFSKLLKRLLEDDPTFVPYRTAVPPWFIKEYVRIFRPPLSRTLKKANKQIKETKQYFNITTPTGIAVIANEGFLSLSPGQIVSLASNILMNSYSSIDCFIYITVNRYVAVEDSTEPKVIWAPVYSERVESSIYPFVNTLGKQWGDFMEQKLGPFTSRFQTEDDGFLFNARPIILSKEKDG